MQFFLQGTHPTWHPRLTHALKAMDSDYLLSLEQSSTWLPGMHYILAAFSEPLANARYILFGESPYPRAESANGQAFWDAAVGPIWRDTGFSKGVNRATSLRNIMKMLLHARGDLVTDFSQPAIAKLDHTRYYQTLDDFFKNMMRQGFLLLNASLVYEDKKIPYHAKHWAPFMEALLDSFIGDTHQVHLILFGRVAEKISGHTRFTSLLAEHPYNLSFITNPDVINFFKPMDLLLHDKYKS
ncbi:MAG: uracil-DNA glycosylase [Legionellaceae bacterium]|nr:uracil-DNA glycosylase [Legionellaceae bacterium]